MSVMRMVHIFSAMALFVLLAGPAMATGPKERGRVLVNSAGCKGCHRLKGSGGTLGPKLDGVGGRLSRQQIRRALVHPRAGGKGPSMMPSYAHLPAADLNALVDYLASLK